MKVLVVGSGGREHALVQACLKSPLVTSVIAAPGNAGIQLDQVQCFPIAVDDIQGLTELAVAQEIDFVIVGPELPLSLGLIEALKERKIIGFGPDTQGAQLEASKAFSKEFLFKYNIPTAGGGIFSDLQSALKYIRNHPFPLVIKASGLAAGKGVVIAHTQGEAEETIQLMMEEKIVGQSGTTLIIEEFLEGSEVSLMVLVCGEAYKLFPLVQDHKQIGEGNIGPNTGGMGACAPVLLGGPQDFQTIEERIIDPVLKALIAEGIDYRGVLYIGLMLTNGGPKVLEFNCRLGDPECQTILPLLNEDAIEAFWQCAIGQLKTGALKLKPLYALTVVHASGGYPGPYEVGKCIELPKNLPKGVHVFQGGTTFNKEDQIVTSGGRVLAVTGLASTLKEAAKRAYKISSKIHFENQYYRKDIGEYQLEVEEERNHNFLFEVVRLLFSKER